MPGWPAVCVCTHAGRDATKAAATIIPTDERRRERFLRCIGRPAAPITAAIASSQFPVLICRILLSPLILLVDITPYSTLSQKARAHTSRRFLYRIARKAERPFRLQHQTSPPLPDPSPYPT